MNQSTRILNISEGLSIAIHTLNALMTLNMEKLTTTQIAKITGFSPNHISKVMRKLVKAEIICADIGANGGFSISKRQLNISLMKVYEAVEGNLKLNDCLYKSPLCDCTNCIFKGIIKSVNKEFSNFLNTTKIKNLNTKIRKAI